MYHHNGRRIFSYHYDISRIYRLNIDEYIAGRDTRRGPVATALQPGGRQAAIFILGHQHTNQASLSVSYDATMIAAPENTRRHAVV